MIVRGKALGVVAAPQVVARADMPAFRDPLEDLADRLELIENRFPLRVARWRGARHRRGVVQLRELLVDLPHRPAAEQTLWQGAPLGRGRGKRGPGGEPLGVVAAPPPPRPAGGAGAAV